MENKKELILAGYCAYEKNQIIWSIVCESNNDIKNMEFMDFCEMVHNEDIASTYVPFKDLDSNEVLKIFSSIKDDANCYDEVKNGYLAGLRVNLFRI